MNTAVVRNFRTTQLPAAPHPAGQLHPMNGASPQNGEVVLVPEGKSQISSSFRFFSREMPASASILEMPEIA